MSAAPLATRITPPRGCTELQEPLGACVAECAHTPSPQVGRSRAALRGIRLVSVLTLLPPLLWLCGRSTARARWMLGVLARASLRAAGIQVRVSGVPVSGSSLVVANHVSWLDLLLLAGYGRVRPVAKIEVGEWPLIGAAARRCGAIFIRRDSLRELPDTVAEMTELLRRGNRVQVFPEGTTRCGTGLDPFHRAAFQAVINAGSVVQPAALSYRVDGQICPAASFVGDTTVVTAVRSALRVRGLVADPPAVRRW